MVPSIINFTCSEFKVKVYKSILPYLDVNSFVPNEKTKLDSIKRIYNAIEYKPKKNTKPGSTDIDVGGKIIKSYQRYFLVNKNKILTPSSFEKENSIVEFNNGEYGSIVAIDEQNCYYNPISVKSKPEYNIYKIGINKTECYLTKTIYIKDKLMIFPTPNPNHFWMSKFY